MLKAEKTMRGSVSGVYKNYAEEGVLPPHHVQLDEAKEVVGHPKRDSGAL
jgi:hypothetical protein